MAATRTDYDDAAAPPLLRKGSAFGQSSCVIPAAATCHAARSSVPVRRDDHQEGKDDPMDLRPDGFGTKAPARARRLPVRIVTPLPPGVVVCLCCGPLSVAGSTAATASRHTGATAHPTVYAAGGQ